MTDVRLDNRLREMNFGDWENRPWDDIPRRELDAWGKDYARRAVPGGESFADLNERTLEFWDELRDSNGKDARIIVFSHAGPIRCMLTHVLGMPVTHTFRLKVDYGGRSLLALGGNDQEATYVRYINRVMD